MCPSGGGLRVSFYGCWLRRPVGPRWFNSEAPFGLHVNPIVSLVSDDVLGDRRKLRKMNHSDSCRFRPLIRFRRDNLEVLHAALPVEPECKFDWSSLQALTVFCELQKDSLECDYVDLWLIQPRCRRPRLCCNATLRENLRAAYQRDDDKGLCTHEV